MRRLLTTPIILSLLAAASARAAEPPGPPPQQPPPAPAWTATPPHTQPLEPAVAVTAAPQAQAPDGQWVYTAQYGWLWMPYDSRYVQVQPDASVAYMFAFYPAFGWRWVVAPWVLGLGASPFWGTLGPRHFGWYGHAYARALPYRGAGWVRPRAVARPVRNLGRHRR